MDIINSRLVFKLKRWKMAFSYGLIVKKKAFNYSLKKIHNFKKEGKALDIGFGAGFMLLSLPKAYEIYGTEENIACITAIRYFAQKKGYRKSDFWNTTELVSLPDNYFDLVICSHVIEHVQDDILLLKQIKRLLSLNGNGIILIPLEANEKEGILLNKEERFLNGNIKFNEGHIWKYNYVTFMRLLEENGFTIVHSIKFDAIWDVFSNLLDERIARKAIILFGLPISIFINFILSIFPFKLILLIDNALNSLGWNYCQAAFMINLRERD